MASRSARPKRTDRPTYLIAHACFACRKSWKLPTGRPARCTECGARLADMGRSFRAPAKRDTEQWEKVRALWDAGFRFWSYRSHPEAERLPERLREVAAFIRRNPDHPFRVHARR